VVKTARVAPPALPSPEPRTARGRPGLGGGVVRRFGISPVERRRLARPRTPYDAFEPLGPNLGVRGHRMRVTASGLVRLVGAGFIDHCIRYRQPRSDGLGGWPSHTMASKEPSTGCHERKDLGMLRLLVQFGLAFEGCTPTPVE